MDGRMTVSAAGVERRFHVARRECALDGLAAPAMMSGMTLQAKKWLPCRQQRCVGSTVRLVTVAAVFGHVGMFKNERPLIFHVATGAHRLDRRLLDKELLR